MTTAAIIVAAGRGRRAGRAGPKQWQMLAGQRVADWTVAAFAAHPAISRLIVVLHPDDMSLAGSFLPGCTCVPGGADRAASVRAGLDALAGDPPDRVLIHDVARPLVDGAQIDRVIAALDTARGAAPALPVTDALWRGDDKVQGVQTRDGLWRAQTPQGFHFDAILDAHRAHPGGATDDVEVARAAGIEVAIVPGDERNLKITLPDDFARAEMYLKGPKMDVRLGNGYDVHAFEDGDHVILCGVKIPHARGLRGHSDADVAMHALTDAIYGALADGDIGRHFPPSDPQWKDAASDIFLRHAIGRAREKGFDLGNCDVTIVCEEPKIGPHAGAMMAELARIMGIDVTRVSVKATTSEQLGFTGRQEGIAALATATLVTS